MLRAIVLLLSCAAAYAQSASRPLNPASKGPPGFKLAAPESTGIRFTNTLTEAQAAANRVLETGSGVAAGDFDGDGLVDLFFCSLSGDCKLYRNLGNLHFEDVTDRSGIRCQGLVCRGAVFADINGDARQDLLISAMGRGVLCFTNSGNGKFENATGFAGTANPFAAMTMALADVDGNGTLDLYVTNYRTNDVRDTGRVNLQSVNGKTVVPLGLQNRFLMVDGKVQEYGEPDLLYLNDGHGHFTPVSWVKGAFRDENGQALTHAPLDWGLTAAFRDLNGDGFPDLYVCNDYWTPDRIWINNGKGEFHGLANAAVRHTSASSMGIDFADIDRDGQIDFFVVDMLARRRVDRMCQMPAYTGPEPLPGEIFDRPQINRNTLFHNRGDGTFEEIGELAGIEASDWSWQPLFMDVDLDGYPDLIIASGHTHAVQDSDANDAVERTRTRWAANEKNVQYEGQMMPYEKAFTLERMRQLRLYPDYRSPLIFFRNRGDLRFEDKSHEWAGGSAAIRHGMVLADLDNDGDLDLVVNTLNSPAEIWINNATGKRVAVELKGRAPNTDAIGAKVTLYGEPLAQQSEEVAAGGHYLSSSQRRIVFAATDQPMHLEVIWRGGARSTLSGLRAGGVYVVTETAP
ncbi:MAG TPA: CRTAC1 family protein [Verrucomicrobiae bacterium]